MLSTTTTLALLTSLLSLAAGKPIEARTPGNVLLCTGENYTGECTTISAPFNECVQLEAPFAKNLGSVKPDAGALCRLTYTADTCTLHGDAFIFPDTPAPTLHHFENAQGEVVDAGSAATSIKCQECTNCV